MRRRSPPDRDAAHDRPGRGGFQNSRGPEKKSSLGYDHRRERSREIPAASPERSFPFLLDLQTAGKKRIRAQRVGECRGSERGNSQSGESVQGRITQSIYTLKLWTKY